MLQKDNVVPIHKKCKKQTLINYYHPVSSLLLPICSKIFETLLYNEMFGSFQGLISANQSGLKPGESYINQLLSTTHNLYKVFDDGRWSYIQITKKGILVTY